MRVVSRLAGLLAVITALGAGGPAALAATYQGACLFTVDGADLGSDQRDRLGQMIVEAICRSAETGESDVGVYSPTLLVPWSGIDLRYQRQLEERADRCAGFDIVARGHVLWSAPAARISLQFGLMRGAEMLVLPPVNQDVALASADEIPGAVASLFFRTWPIPVDPLPGGDVWGAGRTAGLREGDRLWPLDALPGRRAALAAFLERTPPATANQVTDDTAQLAGAETGRVHVRLPWPADRSLAAWQGVLEDASGRPITAGTLVLSDATGWSERVDLAAGPGRVSVPVPISAPIEARLTLPGGVTSHAVLVLDPLAEGSGTWRWDSVDLETAAAAAPVAVATQAPEGALEVSPSTVREAIALTPPLAIDSPEALLTWAADLFRRGEYLQARGVYEQVRGLDPANHLGAFGVAHCAFAMGDYETASRAICDGLSVYPDWIALRLDRRAQYGDERNYDSQVDAAWQALTAWGPHPSLLLALAYHLYYDGAWEPAIDLLRQIPPTVPEGWAARLYLTQFGM